MSTLSNPRLFVSLCLFVLLFVVVLLLLLLLMMI